MNILNVLICHKTQPTIKYMKNMKTDALSNIYNKYSKIPKKYFIRIS